MDTSNYDTKMAELRAAAQTGSITKDKVDEILQRNDRLVRVGRPKGPEKVVYKRNVEPAVAKQLDEWLAYNQLHKGRDGDSKPKEAYIIGKEGKETPNEVEELKKQLMALLEDNEKLTTLVSNQEAKIQRVARLTDNEKLILWIRKYDELKKVYDARFGGSEFSQT